MRNHSSPVLSLALLDDLYLTSGARNGVIMTSNITSGEILWTVKGHLGGVTAVAASRLQRLVHVLPSIVFTHTRFYLSAIYVEENMTVR